MKTRPFQHTCDDCAHKGKASWEEPCESCGENGRPAHSNWEQGEVTDKQQNNGGSVNA